jgi:hypothetical protein
VAILDTLSVLIRRAAAITTDMKRQVYFENWREQLEATIEEFLNRAGEYGLESPERLSLLADLESLREMARQVRFVTPADRESVCSVVMAYTVRAPLQIPPDLIARLGELFEIYRRFRTRLTWEPS